MSPGDDSDIKGGTQSKFPTQTHWTQIIVAGGPTSSFEARAALNELCRIYWFPLYAFVRRAGYDSHKAKDLTQGFFVHLLETDLIKKLIPGKGRFRSFLLTSLSNFLRDEHRKGSAKKRRGGISVVSIDEVEAEATHKPEATSSTQVYTRVGVSETNGDNGGNLVLLGTGTRPPNLHGLWDDALAPSDVKLMTVINSAKKLPAESGWRMC